MAVQSWVSPPPQNVMGLPAGCTPFAVSGTGTTSATVTVTPPTGQNAYITGLVMTEAGGSAISANGSITNTIGGTISFAQLGQLVASFFPPIVGNGSAMVLTTPTATGATASAVTATGYFY